MTWLAYLDGAAVQVAAKLAPWLALLPTAWLVFDRTQRHLGWPWQIALIAAVGLEVLGVAILATALEQYSYNRAKRKSDPKAPLWIPLVLVVLYFMAAELLTVALDIASWLALWAPAVFPVLSVAAMAVLGVRADHQQRVKEIADARVEGKAQRKRRREEKLALQAREDEQQAQQEEAELQPPAFTTKAEGVIWWHEREPMMSSVQLAAAVGCSISTVSRTLQKNGPEPQQERKQEAIES